MKLLIVFALISVAFAVDVVPAMMPVESPAPVPCCTPDEWEGIAVLWDPITEEVVHGYRWYDYKNLRERQEGFEVHGNHSHHRLSILDLYKEKKRYLIDESVQRCDVQLLDHEMRKECLPPGTYFGTFTIGQSLTVNRWHHRHEESQYFATMTKSLCLPVQFIYTHVMGTRKDDIVEWWDVKTKIEDPSVWVPPSYCPT